MNRRGRRPPPVARFDWHAFAAILATLAGIAALIALAGAFLLGIRS